MMGGLLTALVADRFGRRGGLLLNSGLVFAAALLMTLSKGAASYELLVLGRLIAGINAGLTAGLAPLYLCEISPIRYRGGHGYHLPAGPVRVHPVRPAGRHPAAAGQRRQLALSLRTCGDPIGADADVAALLPGVAQVSAHGAVPAKTSRSCVDTPPWHARCALRDGRHEE
ncbi:unnamed protein product [Ixodes persulcatus]